MPPKRKSAAPIIVGVTLIALGIANAIVGWTKMTEFRQRKHAAVAAGGDSVRLPFSGTPSILDPSTDAQLLYESAAIKFEYYRIVLRGGFLFTGAGAVVLVVTTLRRRRKRLRKDAIVVV